MSRDPHLQREFFTPSAQACNIEAKAVKSERGSDEIFLVVIDQTYDNPLFDHEIDSEKYRLSLEIEFGVHFSKTNIGAGADIPSFMTVLTTTEVPAWTLALSIFFLGKPLKENIDAWIKIASKLRRFFSLPVVLSRNGAAALAIEATLDEIGGIPKSIQLISYRSNHFLLEKDPDDNDITNIIEDSPSIIMLGHLVHIFEVDMDGVRFRARVFGKQVTVERL